MTTTTTAGSTVDRDTVAGLLTQLDTATIRALPDAVLAALTDWDDDKCVAVCRAEAQRRDRADRARDRAASAAHDLCVAQQDAYFRAEDECCGQMLNRVGKAAGVDPFTLFSGPEARAHKYASWELLEWWAAHGRLTAASVRRDASMARQHAEELDYARALNS